MAKPGSEGRSAMQSLAGRIEEDRRHDPRADALVANRMARDDILARARQSPLIESEAHIAAERGTPGDRGDSAAAMTDGGIGRGKENRAGAEALAGLAALEPDESRPLGLEQGGTAGQRGADIGLSTARQAFEPEIGQGAAPVDLRPRDMTLLDPPRA